MGRCDGLESTRLFQEDDSRHEVPVSDPFQSVTLVFHFGFQKASLRPALSATLCDVFASTMSTCVASWKSNFPM